MRPRLSPARVLTALVVAGALSGVLIAAFGNSPGALRELAGESRNHGLSNLRLSIVSGFRSCGRDAAASVCAPGARAPSRRTLGIVRRVSDAARAGADPEALHAAALAIMLFSSSGGNHLDQSISYLQSASRLSDRPAPVLADLSAAYLMRARAAGSPRDLFEALEAAERALEHEPANVTARFNVAAALEATEAGPQAAEAWARYLSVDSTSGWAAEARRLRARVVPPVSVRVPTRTASRAELEAFAAAAPAEARELGWDDLLREWGAAVLEGDGSTARTRLEQVEALAAGLVRRGGDASLADAADAARRTTDAPSLRRLAQGHAELGEARGALRAGRYQAGCARLERVLAQAPPRALHEWARTFMGLCALYAPGSASVDLHRLAANADSVRYPALAGRRWLFLATDRYNAGRYEEALDAFARAAAQLERAGEREYAASARMSAGNVHVMLGQADAGYAALHEAVTALRHYPGSLGLNNGLYALRNALLADGLPRAAMHVQDEAVRVADRLDPGFRAETRLARARLHLAAGRRDIMRDTTRAVEIMKTVDERHWQRWLAADLRLTRAEAWLPARPRQAAAELDSVVDHFGDHAPRLLPALFLRAQARLALGLQDEAGVDLHRAATVLDGQRVHVSSAQLRASLLEQSRRVFDQAIMLSVRAGRTEEALDYADRSRSSFSPVGHAPDWARRPLRAPRGQVAVEFALAGDTLLAWTLREGELDLTLRTVPHADLIRNVERVRSALELRSPDVAVLPALEMLYDELIRPLRPRLGPSGTPLVIVADGELAGLPMAALRDREAGRYLVQDHPVRFASSLRDPMLTPLAGDVRPPLSLIAPAFDRAAFPELQPLPGAEAEVDAIARLHRNGRVLDGPRADAAAIRDLFHAGGIAHFAGHAVFDDARPERSFLVAAPGQGQAPDHITAAEVERMDLRKLRLVVLSACQTARTQGGRSGGFAGLAGAFLAAGAGGVVGSLWRVDDHATRTLMEHFHAFYRQSGDAAQALRQAQLRMLQSTDPALRSPAAWAGFRYAGG